MEHKKYPRSRILGIMASSWAFPGMTKLGEGLEDLGKQLKEGADSVGDQIATQHAKNVEVLQAAGEAIDANNKAIVEQVSAQHAKNTEALQAAGKAIDANNKAIGGMKI